MNQILRFLAYFFSRLLLLYPGSFRKEFADEMEIVFREIVMQAAHEGISTLLIVSVREVRGLIIGIVQEAAEKGSANETKRSKKFRY